MHNIPLLDGPSHVIHKFLEAMWQSQREPVVQSFAFELCNPDGTSPVELAELKTLAKNIKVEKATGLVRIFIDHFLQHRALNLKSWIRLLMIKLSMTSSQVTWSILGKS